MLTKKLHLGKRPR
ncbi:hypothetical protein RDI58_014745 [Solanum bulbocastanum]|uniref:Uncharacterized protein n=1 Tax=Solanum bulbocastanum TaxID=147425 RepID=A0AAN8YAV2_SOLBU